MRKRTIYVCIELKNRELNTIIILAAQAALKGYRVYFGSHAAILTLLSALGHKNGILLEKSTQPEKLLKAYSEKFEHIVIMDVELTPIINQAFAEEMLKNRLYPDSLDYISKFICLSPQIQSAAEKLLNPNQAKPNKWLKSELWLNHMPNIYRYETEQIKTRYGKYLLFVSGFRYLEDPINREKFPSAGVIIQNEKNSLQYKRRNYLNFKRSLKILESWDRNLEIPPILVRPHPSEDVRIWGDVLLNFTKTFLAVGEDIAPWILASQGVIHAGSTAAIEATFAKKELFFLRECSILERHELSEKLSQHVVNESAPPILSSFSSMYNDRYDKNFAYSLGVEGELPTETLLKTFAELELTTANRISRAKFNIQFFRYRSMRRALGLIKDEFKWKLKTTNLPPQSLNIPHTIRRRDIEKVLNTEESFLHIRMRHIGINLWELEEIR